MDRWKQHADASQRWAFGWVFLVVTLLAGLVGGLTTGKWILLPTGLALGIANLLLAWRRGVAPWRTPPPPPDPEPF